MARARKTIRDVLIMGRSPDWPSRIFVAFSSGPVFRQASSTSLRRRAARVAVTREHERSRDGREGPQRAPRGRGAPRRPRLPVIMATAEAFVPLKQPSRPRNYRATWHDLRIPLLRPKV